MQLQRNPTSRQVESNSRSVHPPQVLRKADGGSRGFGFVTYKDEISVEKCLVMQHQLGGRTVELKRAIKKEEMPAGGYQAAGVPTTGYGALAGQYDVFPHMCSFCPDDLVEYSWDILVQHYKEFCENASHTMTILHSIDIYRVRL